MQIDQLIAQGTRSTHMSAIRKHEPQQPIRRVFAKEEVGDQLTNDASIARIDVNDVLVENYQRDIKPDKLRRMIKNWNPAIAGWVTISLRDDGMLYAVDGQHRVEAVRVLQGLVGPYVDAIVVNGWSSQHEANFFEETQDPRNRAALLPEDTHKAAVYQGKPDALRIQRIVEDTGFRIGRLDGDEGSGRIKAVKAVYTVVDKYGFSILEDCLSFIGQTWGTKDAPDQSMISGTSLFLALYPQAKIPSLVRRAGKMSQSEFLRIARQRAQHESGMSLFEGIAATLRTEYNKSNHQNPLPAFDDTLRDHRFAMRSEAMIKVRKERS